MSSFKDVIAPIAGLQLGECPSGLGWNEQELPDETDEELDLESLAATLESIMEVN